MHSTTASITIAQHCTQALSWMLLHSLWMGLLMAVVTGAMLALSGNSTAAKRYNLVLMNFMLLVAGCIAAFVWEWNKVDINSLPVNIAGAASPQPFGFWGLNFEALKQFADRCLAYFSANAPTVVLLWFVFFVFRSVKMIGGMLYIHRAKRRLVFDAGEDWTLRVNMLCERLGIRKAVKLMESGYVKVPMVIGSLKPVILIPLGMLSAIPAGQVEAILLHELAHIRRHDFLVNLVQAVAETIFFFNPGLLWISALLREERENCCDDIALNQTKNKKEFVQALISFREHSLYGAGYQVAFPGRKNQLLNRASRIISNKNRSFGTPEKASFTAGVIILLAILSTAAVTGAETVRKTILKSADVLARTKEDVAASSKSVSTGASNNGKHKPGSRNVSWTNHAPIAASPGESRNFVSDAQVQPQQPVEPVRIGGSGSADKIQGARDQEQAVKDQAQARVDQEQAKKDQEGAIRDQEQARKDQAQALIDQMQAKRDQEDGRKEKDRAARDKATQDEARNAEQVQQNDIQAKKNAEQAAHNRDQERVSKIQEKRNSEQAVRNQEQAARNAEQVRLNELQDERNKEQARLNELQAAKNREQEKLNEIQAKKNEEQAKKNNVSVQQ